MADPSIFFVYAVHVPLLHTSGAVQKAVFRGVMVLIRWSAASKKILWKQKHLNFYAAD